MHTSVPILYLYNSDYFVSNAVLFLALRTNSLEHGLQFYISEHVLSDQMAESVLDLILRTCQKYSEVAGLS